MEENQTVNVNWNVDHEYHAIYKAIAHLKPEYRRMVFEWFSVRDLYDVIADDKEYQKWQNEIMCNVEQYMNFYNLLKELRAMIFGRTDTQE